LLISFLKSYANHDSYSVVVVPMLSNRPIGYFKQMVLSKALPSHATLRENKTLKLHYQN